jgi:hypothetical protein
MYVGRRKAGSTGKVSAYVSLYTFRSQSVDGYDLPSALKDWLYPTDGTTRDFATLQVVFGRGEEYFASDKNGKLEYKEPEIKKPAEDEEKIDKPALRRARTVSFLRPLSDVSTRSDSVATEAGENRWSSSTSSRRASRPPSLSYSRTSSAASISSELIEPLPELQSTKISQPSIMSQWEALRASTATSAYASKRSSRSFESPVVESISEELAHMPATTSAEDRTQLASTDSRFRSEFKIPEGYMLVPIGGEATKIPPAACTCGCHETLVPVKTKPTYTNASIQTDALPSPPRTALRIDTMATSDWSTNDYSAVSQADLSPMYDDQPLENPIFMSRMMSSYFSKPGYQLGDSLIRSYHVYEPLLYQYQDEFGEDALR